MIQHIPGCIICYEYNQLKLYHSLFARAVHTDHAILNISCYKDAPLVNTTINGKSIFYYEMSIGNPIDYQLIPLTCMLTTDPTSACIIDQWLRLFLDSEKNAFCSYYMNRSPNDTIRTKCIMCDNSMVLIGKVLECFNNESFEVYSNRCFYNAFNNQVCFFKFLPMINWNFISLFLKKFLDNDNHLGIDFADINNQVLGIFGYIDKSGAKTADKVLIHTCTNQLMYEINKLCKYYYSSGNNFNFGMYAFSVIVNSESLLELQQSIYSFMCILYSGSINSLVKKVFEHLKLRVNYFETLNRMQKIGKDSYYLYNSNFQASKKSYNQKPNSSSSSSLKKVRTTGVKSSDRYYTESIANNHGLSAINRRCRLRKNEADLVEFKLNNLNRQSMFYKMCELIFEKCKDDIEKCEANLDQSELARNPRQGHQLLYYFIHQFSASLPLWTNINMPSMKNKNNNDFKWPMTLAAQVCFWEF